MRHFDPYLIYPMHKIIFFIIQKMKNDFLYRKLEKSSHQQCQKWQDAPPCPILAHYNKLCHKYGHSYAICWLETHESSYTRVRFVKTFCFLLPYHRFLIFPVNQYTYKHSMRKGFIFEVFFIFIYLFQNQVKMVDMIIHAKGSNISRQHMCLPVQ